MRAPSHHYSLQVLMLQLADDGRENALLGDSLARARSASEPFMVGEEFPAVYLEFPLSGDPFLDLTVVYGNFSPGTYVNAEAAEGTEAICDWFSSVLAEHPEYIEPGNISFGYELDTSKPELPPAAVHFQPRRHIELVEPFFKAAGEPERAKLYLDLAARMPRGWPLSFFGMFRGRPDSPLRVSGYLDPDEQDACADDPSRLAAVFDAVGFSAYDDRMLSDVSRLMATAPRALDFQFDAYPDGHLSDVFAIDAQFQIEQPEAVRESFESGAASRLMGLFEEWGVADSRWKLAADAAFARSLPMERDDGSPGRYVFALFPQWVKARWRGKAVQPAKLYCIARAGFLN